MLPNMYSPLPPDSSSPAQSPSVDLEIDVCRHLAIISASFGLSFLLISIYMQCTSPASQPMDFDGPSPWRRRRITTSQLTLTNLSDSLPLDHPHTRKTITINKKKPWLAGTITVCMYLHTCHRVQESAGWPSHLSNHSRYTVALQFLEPRRERRCLGGEIIITIIITTWGSNVHALYNPSFARALSSELSPLFVLAEAVCAGIHIH